MTHSQPVFPWPNRFARALVAAARRGVCALFAASAVLVPLWAGPAARAAEDPEAFTVRSVAVDATADTAARARDQALAAGQLAAFNRLLARLTLASDRDKLPAISTEAVSDLVRDFEVADEKTSAVRYLALLTVRFKPDAVRGLLRERGAGFAETRSRPLLVLPVYELVGALSLWDEPNPWREAWARVRSPDGLVPVVRANGDLQDVALIGAEQAVRGDDKRLAAIAARHGASDVLVARASMRYPDSARPAEGSGPWLQVTLSRFGTTQLEQTRVEAFYPEGGESLQATLERAAVAIAEQIQENWKRNNRLRFDTGDELTVEVPLASLAQWIDIKSRLEKISFIRRSDLILLNRKGARVRLNFMGDEEQLRLALLQSDLTIERGATALILRSGAPREGAGR
ncbi:MAG: hypothetical protein RL477_1966 [Pseudomonadota bacterium]